MIELLRLDLTEYHNTLSNMGLEELNCELIESDDRLKIKTSIAESSTHESITEEAFCCISVIEEALHNINVKKYINRC